MSGFILDGNDKCVVDDPCKNLNGKTQCLRVGVNDRKAKIVCPKGFVLDGLGAEVKCVLSPVIKRDTCPAFFSTLVGCEHSCELSFKDGVLDTPCKCYPGFTLENKKECSEEIPAPAASQGAKNRKKREDGDEPVPDPVPEPPCKKKCGSNGVCVKEKPAEDQEEVEVCKCLSGYLLLDDDKCVKYCEVASWETNDCQENTDNPDTCLELVRYTRNEIQAICGKGLARCEQDKETNQVSCANCPLNHVLDEKTGTCKMSDPCENEDACLGDGKMCVRKPVLDPSSDQFHYPFFPDHICECDYGFTIETKGVGFECVEQCSAREHRARCEVKSMHCRRKFSKREPECVCPIPGYVSKKDPTDNKFKCTGPEEPIQISGIVFSLLIDDYVSLINDGKIRDIVEARMIDVNDLAEQEKNCESAPDREACLVFVNRAAQQFHYQYMKPEAQKEVIDDAMLLQLRRAVKDSLSMITDATENDVSLFNYERTNNLVETVLVIDKKKTTEAGKLDAALKAACKVTSDPKICQLGQGKNRVLLHNINGIEEKKYNPCNAGVCKYYLETWLNLHLINLCMSAVPNGQCKEVDARCVCTCSKGFKKEDRNKIGLDAVCIDINECIEGVEDAPDVPPCPLNSKCVNTIGSFKCNCNEGFKKDVDKSGKEICREGKVFKADVS